MNGSQTFCMFPARPETDTGASTGIGLKAGAGQNWKAGTERPGPECRVLWRDAG